MCACLSASACALNSFPANRSGLCVAQYIQIYIIYIYVYIIYIYIYNIYIYIYMYIFINT
jgi:hypothetical protein